MRRCIADGEAYVDVLKYLMFSMSSISLSLFGVLG